MKFTHTPEKRAPKVTAACTTDKTYPTLQQPHLNVELGELQASDRYVAVRVPVEVEKGDTSGPLDAKQIAEAHKTKAPSLKAGKTGRPKPPGEFPKVEELWPTAKEIAGGLRVGFNADFLKRVADAVGAKNGAIELIFPVCGKDGGPSPQRAILVRPMRKESQGDYYGVELEARTDGGGVAIPEGILMPIRLAGQAASKPSKPAASKPAKSPKPAPSNGKPAIPYADVPVDQLTAGQKAARTKALKAAGLTEPPPAKGGKPDLTTALKTAVKQAGKAKAPGKAASSKPSTRSKPANGDGRKKPTWTPEQLTARALKAAETRRQRLAAAA